MRNHTQPTIRRGSWTARPTSSAARGGNTRTSAEKLITGPGFDVLADRMAHAQQAGLDAGALLETIDPDKIAAADVPSPAGITAAALTRAAADAQIPAWTEREYGHFTDETLADELAHARARLEAAVAEQAAAAKDATRLAEEAAAGRGPAVTRLEQELAELHRTAQELARHSALEADWRTAIQTAQAAAAAAAIAEHERNQLRTRARRRRAELDARITELHQQEAEAHEGGRCRRRSRQHPRPGAQGSGRTRADRRTHRRRR